MKAANGEDKRLAVGTAGTCPVCRRVIGYEPGGGGHVKRLLGRHNNPATGRPCQGIGGPSVERGGGTSGA